MESSVSSTHGATPPASALIVDPALSDVLFLVAIVSSLGFHVTVADTFADGLERLRLQPALLIAEIRLGEYNGLHLVLRGKSAKPNLAAIVTSTVPDPVLQLEAEQLGATFVLKPIAEEELRAAIVRTMFRAAESGAGSIRRPFERRKAERRTPGAAPYASERRVRDRRKDRFALSEDAVSMQ
jgi:CheY-like chemotaxis protein